MTRGKTMETLSFANWKATGFPGVPKGATVLSSRPGHWATWGITIFEALRRWHLCHWRHAMHYAGQGEVWTQDATKRKASLEEYIGQDLRFAWPLDDTSEIQDRIIEEEELTEGTGYDVPGIVGQMGGILPKLGNLLRKYIQAPFLNFCSESIIEIRRKVRTGFCEPGPAQQSPADIAAWIAEKVKQGEWEQLTVKLVA